MSRLNQVKYLNAWTDFVWAGPGTIPAITAGQLVQATEVAVPSDPLTGALAIGAKVMALLQMNTAPTASTIYNVYAIYGDAVGNRDDGLGAGPLGTSAPTVLRVINALQLGQIQVENVGTPQKYGSTFDTAPHGPLIDKFNIVIRNGTNQANLAANGKTQYRFYAPQAQNEA